jgi:Ca2+-binding EF-hand superfamily protein
MAFISLFGYTPDERDVKKLMQERETVCFEEFFEAVAVRYANRDEQEDTRQAFLAMDASCRGFLTVVDLRKAMKIVAPWLEKRADEIFRELDTDEDGRVSYKEFETMMQTMAMRNA